MGANFQRGLQEIRPGPAIELGLRHFCSGKYSAMAHRRNRSGISTAQKSNYVIVGKSIQE
jgi:hypothetical protein